MGEFQDNVRKHQNIFYIVQACIVFIEFVCVWFGLMMRKHDGDILNDGYEEFSHSNSKSDDLNFDTGAVDDEKPITDAQKKRHLMRYCLDQVQMSYCGAY